jgi:hypothetical protein
VAYVRTAKTSSGATAAQIVWSWRKGSRSIENLGSAHDDVELAALKTTAVKRLAAAQGIPAVCCAEDVKHLREVLCAAYRILGFESATKSDTVFRDPVLPRIIEPSSKIDAEPVAAGPPAHPGLRQFVRQQLAPELGQSAIGRV